MLFCTITQDKECTDSVRGCTSLVTAPVHAFMCTCVMVLYMEIAKGTINLANLFKTINKLSHPTSSSPSCPMHTHTESILSTSLVLMCLLTQTDIHLTHAQLLHIWLQVIIYCPTILCKGDFLVDKTGTHGT